MWSSYYIIQMVEQHLISDLATIVDDYSREMWLFSAGSAGETRYLYRSKDAALKHACEWMYKKINDHLGENLYGLDLFSQHRQDYFIVSNDSGVDYVIRLKETLQNNYNKLLDLYAVMWHVNHSVVEQLHYCTKDDIKLI